MQALQKRRERWEYHNQQRLELVLEISQLQLQKQIRWTINSASFLLYLAYQGGKLMLRVLRVLWVHPRDLDQRLQDAEQQRLKLNSFGNHWLK